MFITGEPKVRDLTIHVDTGSAIGPKGLPLVYGHQDTHTILHVTVKFESSHDCKAKAVEIFFRAAVKTFYFDVERPKAGWIAKGTYARQCSVLLDPSLPSSSVSPFGSMRYIFEARLKGAKGIGIARTDWVVTQEVWVLNSSLPFLSTSLIDNPIVVQDQWKDSLPYSLSIPSDTLHFGQVVPITIQLEPFRSGCAFEGDEAVVTSASFTLREKKTFRAMFVRDTYETSEKLLHIAVNTGWPQSIDGWQRTIHVSMPLSPAMSADMQTKYLDVAHTLIVLVEFKSSRMVKAEKLRAQVDVQITAPRPLSTSLPPQYGDAVPVESLLLVEPAPAFDADEPLPGYSRYE
ncbi:hypothetical protein BGZ54_006927 [Gamsiella multidivaricata]|nr:hypothetical protein BGZ54_006927 [Gamsiella multidivaricata]